MAAKIQVTQFCSGVAFLTGSGTAPENSFNFGVCNIVGHFSDHRSTEKMTAEERVDSRLGPKVPVAVGIEVLAS